MRRLFSLLLVIAVLLTPFPPASAGYLGAESLDFHVAITYGDSALLSLEYVSYSTSINGTLVSTGYFYYNFYVNSSGAYFVGSSIEKPQAYWYRGFYYIFLPEKGSIGVYRMGEDCFIKVTDVESRADAVPNFAVAVPYLVVQTSENELIAINIARNVAVGTLDLREAENGTYFRGVTIIKEGDNIKLKGDSPEKPPTAMAVYVSGDTLRIPEGNIELPLNSVGKYLWAREEAEYLRGYRLENALLLVPPSVTHYFAPEANSTGELLKFGNESVAVSGIADVYALYYDGNLRPLLLGEPTGSGFLVKADNVTFTECEVPKTYALEFWAAVVLLALIGFMWFFMVKGQ